MKKFILIFLVFIPLLNDAQSLVEDYPITPVDFTKVHITGGFWKSRLDTVSHRTIPYAFAKCEETGRINNFIYAGKIKDGKFQGRFGFDDSDVYKIMEGAAYALMNEPNPALRAYLDKVISYIAAAQESDGYLYTAWTLKANDYNNFSCCTYDPKGQFLGTHSSHELYNVGHMYEAAVAHYRATGQDNFLKIAIKNADLIYQKCVIEKMGFYPGHQEIELGLIKLYRVTNDKKYLDLAKLFLERRGHQLNLDEKGLQNASYSQNHIPVTEQSEAVGHSVRAGYMYAAMTDIAAITGDQAYLKAVDKIWNDIISKKMYITGGLGAAHGIEGFDRAYELPNDAYAETCAAIAYVYWNHRMFLLHGDSKYIDVMERTLYNGLMSGIALEGEKFFYPNPLVFDGSEKFNQGAVCRSPWFDCSCCPSNLSRFVPSVSGYAYAVKDNNIYVNLFMASKASLNVNSHAVEIQQKTDYPWSGAVELLIDGTIDATTNIYIRIPGWAQNEVVPSDLYRFNATSKTKTNIAINGKKINFSVEHGYAVLHSNWKKGDKISVQFPMESKSISSHPNIKANTGAIAIERGPILYCAEEMDNGHHGLALNNNTNWKAEYKPDLLNGVTILKGKAFDDKGSNTTATLIPYVVWGHRETSPMAVWIKKK